MLAMKLFKITPSTRCRRRGRDQVEAAVAAFACGEDRGIARTHRCVHLDAPPSALGAGSFKVQPVHFWYPAGAEAHAH